MDDTDVIPLCLLLPQMSGWIKYFENGGKNMSFKIEDESVYVIKHFLMEIKYRKKGLNILVWLVLVLIVF